MTTPITPSSITNSRPKSRSNLQDKMKKGKTFYKGRQRQIDRDRNPSQWSAYDKAPRVRKHIQHFDPLSKQLTDTRIDGILSTKTLDQNFNDEENKIDVDNVCKILALFVSLHKHIKLFLNN